MCCLNALLRTNLPVPVFLNRLAAPRCVFNLGMMLYFYLLPSTFYLLPSAFLLLAFFFRLFALRRWPLRASFLRQDRVHLVAFLSRRGFGRRYVAEIVDQPFEDPAPDFGMRHLAA